MKNGNHQKPTSNVIGKTKKWLGIVSRIRKKKTKEKKEEGLVKKNE